MKRLYMIGGPMGVGKTAACRQLQQLLDRSVFLDRDWCWDAHPFQVTEETREMVLENISFRLNSFLRCSAYDHVWPVNYNCDGKIAVSGLYQDH